MSNISNFKRIRVGSGFPAVIDVEPIDNFHESLGVIGMVYPQRFDDGSNLPAGWVEIRKRDDVIAIITSRYDMFADLPEYWKDSELIYSSKEESDA